MARQYNMTQQEAFDQFDSCYMSNSLTTQKRKPLMTDFFLSNHPLSMVRLPRNQFYCGITNDLDRRMSEHNATLLTCVTAKDADCAIALEKQLGETGFDIGSKAGNGATDDSCIVYMYKKIPGVTKE